MKNALVLCRIDGPAAALAIVLIASSACSPGSAAELAGREDTVAPRAGGAAGGFACFGTKAKGATCLSADGWKTYTSENSGLTATGFRDMKACPDGRIYAATFRDMAVFNGSSWESIPVANEKYYGADFIACAPDGSVWTGSSLGIGRYAQGEWTTFPVDAYDTGEFPGLIYGLAAAPDGTVWTVTARSVASYNGKTWTIYKEGDGFENEISPNGLAVDSRNRAWVLEYDTLYIFDAGVWSSRPASGSFFPNSMVFDPRDRLWINTGADGVKIAAGSNWDGLSLADGEIDGNGVFMAAFDQSGRAWLAMAYGVDVISNTGRRHYRMDNSGLADNEIVAVAVVGDGPPFPEEKDTSTGSIRGRIFYGGKVLADAEIELCVESLHLAFAGGNPCGSQPYHRHLVSDAEGGFSAAEMRAGYYYLTVNVFGKWIALDGAGTRRILIEEERETDLGDVEMKPEQS
jgi:hypothetical protein